MNAHWTTMPILVFGLWLLGAAGLHWLGGKLAMPGAEMPEKHLPYACGEDVGQPEAQLSYRRFFRLALMFVVVHMATLVVALLPVAVDARILATFYLAGVAVCVDVLVTGED
jgi:NADH:ubiquinone oxidoreductase subunit 3 (subunit A)